MEKDKKNPPKLELRSSEAATLRLLKDKPYEGKNNYGPFYLYSVSHEGTEKSFFAPAEVHAQIQQLGLKTGSEFILRNESQNGKAQLAFIAIGQDHSVVPVNGGDNFMEIMRKSLQDAIELTKVVNTIPWQNDDIRSISSCLFIARTRA